MENCLRYNLTLTDDNFAKALPPETCEIVARLAGLSISFTNTANAGKCLLEALEKSGFTAQEYKKFLNTALNTKIVWTYYKPSAKVAILVANDHYLNLSKLATPSVDCNSIGASLQNLGFSVVTIKNTRSAELKSIFEEVLKVVPENSYCFIYYAGHGCEICNTKCVLGVDCPTTDITADHCFTENDILNTVALAKPELCILIMDMCRISLDRESNPQLYSSLLTTPPIEMHSNLLISYSTQPSSQAYELVQKEFTTTVDINVTQELKTEDLGNVTPKRSLYVDALITRLTDNSDISTMLDKVHADVENATITKKQKPTKVQCGTAKRSLYDPATGDPNSLLAALKESCKDYNTQCSVYSRISEEMSRSPITAGRADNMMLFYCKS